MFSDKDCSPEVGLGCCSLGGVLPRLTTSNSSINSSSSLESPSAPNNSSSLSSFGSLLLATFNRGDFLSSFSLLFRDEGDLGVVDGLFQKVHVDLTVVSHIENTNAIRMKLQLAWGQRMRSTIC